MSAADEAKPCSTPPRFQFGIGRLLLVTTFAAVLCSFTVCTHWIVSATLGAIVVMAWTAGRIVRSPIIRNFIVCVGAIPIVFALDYLEHHCGVTALDKFEALFWPVLYLSTFWANWHIVRKDRSPWLIWSVRIVLSALLLPLFAVIIIITVLYIDIALGLPILHS
jgi:hypothetical protein